MAASFKQSMMRIAGKKAPGPSTTFTIFHIFYALELMAEKPIGRNKLAEKLFVGDGAVRTIISRLREADLIDTSKEGCNLTKKGIEVWQHFEQIFPKRLELPKSELYGSEHNYAFLVRNVGHEVKSGIDQRDAAIIAGARKALIIVFKNGHLSISAVSDALEKEYPKAANQLLPLLSPQENDVIIVAGAETTLKAKRGAFAASWSLITP
jgi:predicted transcriptional regulator